MFDLVEKFDEIGIDNLYISEITVAELKFGAAKSEHPIKNKQVIEELINKFNQIPIYKSLDIIFFFWKKKTKTINQTIWIMPCRNSQLRESN